MVNAVASTIMLGNPDLAPLPPTPCMLYGLSLQAIRSLSPSTRRLFIFSAVGYLSGLCMKTVYDCALEIE